MRKKYFCLIISVLLITGSRICAQDTTNADGLFLAARKAAFDNKDYGLAIHYARKALSLNPQYADILVFTGRVYTWKKEPDSARVYFEKAINLEPPTFDAFAAYAGRKEIIFHAHKIKGTLRFIGCTIPADIVENIEHNRDLPIDKVRLLVEEINGYWLKAAAECNELLG